MAEDVTVHPPGDPDAPWMIQRGADRYYRVGSDVARLAQALDGRRDVDALVERLGGPWRRTSVLTVLRTLHEQKLLDDGQDRAPGRDRRVKFVPPLTVQFTLLRPERLLARLRPLTARLAARPGAVAALAVTLGGVFALAAQAPAVGDALGKPLSVGVYVTVVCAFFASTALHEFGHGAVLTYYGGRPARIGVMLFYLAPAFFCDVTDGWRLPRARQRVHVALAGVAVQGVIAGATGMLAAALPAGDARSGALLFSCVAYVSCLLNLLPLVKLDGYLALMSHLDIPYLRDRAMSDARGFLSRMLFGGRHPRALDTPWSVPFGLACMAFPVYMLTTGLTIWSDLFLAMGVFGTFALAGVLAYLAYLWGKGLLHLIREARKTGAGTARVCLATGALAIALTGMLAGVKAPYTVTGAYVRQGDHVDLVLASTADQGIVREGAQVVLEQAGLVTSTQTGRGAVASAEGERGGAPMTLFAPVRMEDAPHLAVVTYPLSVAEAPSAPTGTAQVDGGDVPLGKLLYLKITAPWRR
ncbi:daptide biosynthesis intramembrane metalloprotease [Streptomyces sp. DSM 41972]|uniref:Daptide biosynthesis intramembrane metalloprotease n=1 Tax=Streptomyces althioticus subsp. attaecolombicae TaxID=3075534 RepID=A0ABU3I1F0_9ACTN|nr:daptide biosynthesis intramembrane metalloprotease [Streptomyces sp. DSM 41972]